LRQQLIVMFCACVCALAGALVAHADPGDSGAPTEPSATTPTADATAAQVVDKAHTQRLIDRYRRRTWHWQRVMLQRLTLTLAHPPSDPFARIRVWKELSLRVARTAMHPPHLRAWACIHRYEGSWTSVGPPYYGGLQMDLGFQRTYGSALLARKGTANYWTPLEQMWVAERALRVGRGFWPWPNTARLCGVL
jgi:hypothetical protein